MQLSTSPLAVTHLRPPSPPLSKIQSISNTSLHKLGRESHEEEHDPESRSRPSSTASLTKQVSHVTFDEHEPAERVVATDVTIAVEEVNEVFETQEPKEDLDTTIHVDTETVHASPSPLREVAATRTKSQLSIEEDRRPRSSTITSTRSNYSTFSQKYHEEEHAHHSFAFKIVRSAMMTQQLLMQFFEESFPIPTGRPVW